MPWKCNCGLINASANKRCAGINHFTNAEHYQYTASTYDSSLYWTRERSFKLLTHEEDKFRQFFNAEMVLISSMTEAQRIDHIQELEEIAFEAKTRLTAAKTHERDQKGKKFSGGDNTITPLNPDQTTSDSINRVKLREKRMTKLDKTRASLEKLGLGQQEIDAMIAAMVKQAKKDNPSEPSVNVGIVPNELREQRKEEKARLNQKDKDDEDGVNGTAVAKPEPNKPNAPASANEQLFPEKKDENKPFDFSSLGFK